MAGKRLGFGEKYHSILTIIAQPRVPSVDETKVVPYGLSMLSGGKSPVEPSNSPPLYGSFLNYVDKQR